MRAWGTSEGVIPDNSLGRGLIGSVSPIEAYEELVELTYWEPGTQIIQYEMWGQGIGTARPVTVVGDGANHIALYSHPGTLKASRGMENRHSLSLSERIELYLQMLEPSVGEFRDEVTSDNHVLTLTPPNSWHSVWLFWSSEWQFKTWYVNFQSPIRRVRHGIQLHDYALDIVVRPDMSWSWKDVEEFEELVVRGFFTTEQESSIRAEADQMIRTIETCGPPFCHGWEHWRPDSSWPVPHLPSDWLVDD